MRTSSQTGREYEPRSWRLRPNAALIDPDRWYRDHVVDDLKSLERRSRELLERVEAQGVRREVAEKAAKVAKLARNIWNNIQQGKSGRAKPASAPDGAAGPIALEDVRTIRRLVEDVVKALHEEDRRHEVDAARRNEVLVELERINTLALRISIAR